MNPLVSIIITTYNSSSTIERLLKSILLQTSNDYELLIFDDASRDDTAMVVREFLRDKDVPFNIFENPVNGGGPAIGRNWGIDQARGRYICFCDADDEWLPGKLEAQINFLENSPLDFCGTRCFVVGHKQFPHHHGEVPLLSQLSRNKFSLSSLMFKSAVFESPENRFDERKEYFGVEDFELILRLYSRGIRGYVLDSVLVNYHYGDSSLSHLDLAKSERKRILVLNNFKHKSIFVMFYRRAILTLLQMRLTFYGIRTRIR